MGLVVNLFYTRESKSRGGCQMIITELEVIKGFSARENIG